MRKWKGQGVQEVRGRWRGEVEEQPCERIFFFFLNKSVTELNRGKGKVEVCESNKYDVAVFGEA